MTYNCNFWLASAASKKCTHPTFSNYIFWTGLFSILAKTLSWAVHLGQKPGVYSTPSRLSRKRKCQCLLSLSLHQANLRYRPYRAQYSVAIPLQCSVAIPFGCFKSRNQNRSNLCRQNFAPSWNIAHLEYRFARSRVLARIENLPVQNI